MTAAEIVLDASVAVRGLLAESSATVAVADDIVSGGTSAHAPSLIVSEVTNALRMRVDAERWPLREAAAALDVFLDWPLSIRPSPPMATAALAFAVEHGLSAYDAFYAALSEALEAPLYTSDCRLAAAVHGSVLVA